ncbi:MAG: hypothetical protein FJ271_10410 [Planctomycetes bacterium]|nr:hypothetical protein [Planctomycetota bacterium]
MGWQHFTAFTLAGIGALGFCLMIVAFVMIALQGGWKQSIQQPMAEGRWPMGRRLLLVGAALGLVFAIGIFVLAMIPGGIPWRN